MSVSVESFGCNGFELDRSEIEEAGRFPLYIDYGRIKSPICHVRDTYPTLRLY